MTGFNEQVLDHFLSQHQIRLRLDNPLHLLLIRLLVGLCPRAVHGRAFAAIEQAELDAGGVDRPAHRAPQRVDLADNLPLGHAADRRIATHLRHGIAVGGQQSRARPHPRRGQRRFTAGMAGADDEDVEFVKRGHHFGIGNMIAAFSSKLTSPGLPLMRYCTLSCLGVLGTGSPPKLSL